MADRYRASAGQHGQPYRVHAVPARSLEGFQRNVAVNSVHQSESVNNLGTNTVVKARDRCQLKFVFCRCKGLRCLVRSEECFKASSSPTHCCEVPCCCKALPCAGFRMLPGDRRAYHPVSAQVLWRCKALSSPVHAAGCFKASSGPIRCEVLYCCKALSFPVLTAGCLHEISGQVIQSQQKFLSRCDA